jgi:hypothetical protein
MKKLFLMAGLLLAPLNLQANEPLAVVELFTSQGCSSCPPADEYLGQLSKRDDVLALAYHVDYWDYIGWKDEYASSAYTQRQRQYAQQFNLRYVYTPQMVVSGIYENSGNRRPQIKRAVDQAPAGALNLTLDRNAEQITVNMQSERTDLMVFQVDYLPEITTAVKRGENRGRNLKEYNIVTNLIPLGYLQNGTAQFTMTGAPLKENESRALFVQGQSDMTIFGGFKL